MGCARNRQKKFHQTEVCEICKQFNFKCYVNESFKEDIPFYKLSTLYFNPFIKIYTGFRLSLILLTEIYASRFQTDNSFFMFM